MSSPSLTSLIVHRIKYRLLTWSTRPSILLFWPTSLTSSYDILYLAHLVLAKATFSQLLPSFSFFNSLSLFLPQGFALAASQAWILFSNFLHGIQMTT